MNITSGESPHFGWNIKTHRAITDTALEDNDKLSTKEKRMVGQYSKMPDLIKEEVEDMCAAHFYDVLHEDPSFGTKDDDKNNALSKFLAHDAAAKKASVEGNYDQFLREIGFAAHYLQDAGTPPHVEHGNYFHKLYRVPMHTAFEKGKSHGASSKLDTLKTNYTQEDIPLSTLPMLLHNTALYSVQPENRVGYDNVNKWDEIQQRCFDRSTNATKTYFNYILDYLPKNPEE